LASATAATSAADSIDRAVPDKDIIRATPELEQKYHRIHRKGHNITLYPVQ
jgi:hypothetical protein